MVTLKNEKVDLLGINLFLCLPSILNKKMPHLVRHFLFNDYFFYSNLFLPCLHK
jgi:hypothetical protein